MDVQTTKLWRIKNRLWQNQAIGRDHCDIGVERGKGGMFIFSFQRCGCPNFQSQLFSPFSAGTAKSGVPMKMMRILVLSNTAALSLSKGACQPKRKP